MYRNKRTDQTSGRDVDMLRHRDEMMQNRNPVYKRQGMIEDKEIDRARVKSLFDNKR